MKKQILFVLVTLLVIPLSAQSLRLVGDSWAPFSDVEGTAPGFMVELAGAVLTKAGFTWTYSQVPWSRAIGETQKGTAHILVAVPEDQAAEAGLLLCPTPYGMTTVDFFTPAGSTWSYKSMDSLTGISLGVIQDYSYSEELDLYIEKNRADLNLIQFSTGDNPMETSLRKLVAGRIKVIVDDRAVIQWNAAKLSLGDKIRYAGTQGAPLPMYLAVSPAHPQAKKINQALSEGLAALRKTPEFTRILGKYGVKPW